MDNRKEATRLDQIIAEYFNCGVELTQHSLKHVKGKLAELSIVLCGGAINSLFSDEPINDLDFYVEDPRELQNAKNWFAGFGTEIPFISLNAITYRRKKHGSNRKYTVQLITRFTGEPQKIFNDFDFTITHGAYRFKDDSFVFGERFFQDLAKRRLVYSGNSEYPICAMYRTKKYQAKGYTVPGSTIMHIALSIVRLKIETYGDLKKQLNGIDTLYLQNLLSKEKYGDAIPVDYAEFLMDAFSAIDGFDFEDSYE
jgi:hypothetical protein